MTKYDLKVAKGHKGTIF